MTAKKRAPEDVLIAAWDCLDDGDGDGADALAKMLFDSDIREVRGEALLVSAHAQTLLGALEAARELLAKASPLLPDDDECLTDAANVALALGDARAAADLADRALALAPADEQLADAAYARGLAAQAQGDEATAREMFLRTASLDASEPDPPWAMSLDEFAAIAEATLEELPAAVIERLENVPIIIEPAPSAELIADGIDPRLLGLFSGVPLPERSAIDEGPPSLDAIHLFQRNLERACGDADELAEEIRITVAHETAHFFGLEDDDLEELGLG